MPRPKTKLELLEAANKGFSQLQLLIDSMLDEEQQAEFNFGDVSNEKEAHWKRDRNIRDVLVHLYEWHQLLLRWIAANQNGEAQPFLPQPYNWKTCGSMNEGFWKKHQNTSYAESRQMVGESHQEVLTVIETFSDEELFEKRHFSWTGTSSLGSYCVSATSSHYDWAIKKIKRHKKTSGF